MEADNRDFHYGVQQMKERMYSKNKYMLLYTVHCTVYSIDK